MLHSHSSSVHGNAPLHNQSPDVCHCHYIYYRSVLVSAMLPWHNVYHCWARWPVMYKWDYLCSSMIGCMALILYVSLVCISTPSGQLKSQTALHISVFSGFALTRIHWYHCAAVKVIYSGANSTPLCNQQCSSNTSSMTGSDWYLQYSTDTAYTCMECHRQNAHPPTTSNMSLILHV